MKIDAVYAATHRASLPVITLHIPPPCRLNVFRHVRGSKRARWLPSPRLKAPTIFTTARETRRRRRVAGKKKKAHKSPNFSNETEETRSILEIGESNPSLYIRFPSNSSAIARFYRIPFPRPRDLLLPIYPSHPFFLHLLLRRKNIPTNHRRYCLTSLPHSPFPE